MAEFPHPLRAGSFRCPAHQDHAPSLTITQVGDGRWLLTCHAGCTVPEILRAAGLTWADLFPASSRPPGPRRLRIVPPPTLDPEAARDVLDEEARHADRRAEYAPEWAVSSRIRTLRRRADLLRRFAGRYGEAAEAGWVLRAVAARLDTQADNLELALDEALDG